MRQRTRRPAPGCWSGIIGCPTTPFKLGETPKLDSWGIKNKPKAKSQKPKPRTGSRQPAAGRRLYNNCVQFSIRDSRRDDFEHLWRIDQRCFPPEISYSRLELAVYMRRSGSFTLVAETAANNGNPRTSAQPSGAEQAILGFIVAQAQRRGMGHIITIDVIDKARRTGVGSKLLSAAEDRLRSAGCHNVHLETAVDNVAALAFYKRHGYNLEKTVPRYYSNGVDAFILKKDLLPPPPAS
jgi:[ribosomal protein S18]-alanine N-acetyltransferase